MKAFVHSLVPLVVIIGAVGTTCWSLLANQRAQPIVGTIARSTVDSAGHTRGIVQVDLMRQLMASQTRLVHPSADRTITSASVPSQSHPLLGRPAPEFKLEDPSGMTWSLHEQFRDGPVVVVFYLGATCMACMTHLTELDFALPQFGARGARVMAVSADTPAFSAARIAKYGTFQIPLLHDRDHKAARAFGTQSADAAQSPRHGTFVVDKKGVVRWAYVGNRPFTNIRAVLTEVDRLKDASPDTQ
jgi:peroxiredoxin